MSSKPGRYIGIYDSLEQRPPLDVDQGGTGATSLTDNSILTGTGTAAITAESGLTWDGDNLLISSATTQKPYLNILSTTNDNKGSVLRFTSDKGAAGAAADVIGTIEFYGDNADQTQLSFGMLQSTVLNPAVNDVSGVLGLHVLESDGSGNTGMGNVIKGSGQNDETVDVILAAGSSSTTTTAGGLIVGGSSKTTIVDDATSGAIHTIDGGSLTTGNALKITDATYERANHILIDVDDTTATTLNRGGLGMFNLNYDRTNSYAMGGGQQVQTQGASIRMNDDASHHGTATVDLRGLSVHVDFADSTGTTTALGIVTQVGGASTNADIKMINNADDSEYATMSVGAGGSMRIETTSDDATGHIKLDADGNIELNADAGEINFKDDAAQLALISTTGLDFTDNTGAGIIFEGATDNAHKTTLNVVDPTDTRAINLPDADGTVQLQGENTGQVIHVSIKDPNSYLFYAYNDDYWYSAGGGTLAILGQLTSLSDISSANSEYQGRLASYTAMSACTVKKLTFTFYWTSSVVNSADIDFAFSKFTPITDGTADTITMNEITATDHDGSYTEVKPYSKTFTFSGGNATLAAGDCFGFHMRTTGGQSAQRVILYGSAVLSVELT